MAPGCGAGTSVSNEAQPAAIGLIVRCVSLDIVQRHVSTLQRLARFSSSKAYIGVAANEL